MPLEGSGHALRLHGSDTSRQCPHEQNFGAMRKPVGPYREAAMALTFDTDVVGYDVEEELLGFLQLKVCCSFNVAYQ